MSDVVRRAPSVFERSSTRRAAVAGLLSCAATPLAGFFRPARAEEAWPTRQVSVVVPYPPGGYIDVVARVVSDGLSQRTNQPFIVLNRPGGNGQVALGDLTRTKPDGYTLLINNDGGICVQPMFDHNFHFDPLKDYTPLNQVVASSFVVAVRSSLPIHSIPELIAYAKKSSKSLTFGSPGTGTTPHIGMEYFARRAGIELLHVPYSGGNGAMNDLMAGQIDLYMATVGTIVGLIGSDRIRVLATMSATRVPQLPDVPTMAEAGLDGFAIPGWLGLFGPPNMSPQLRAIVSKTVSDTVRDPRFAANLSKISAEPVTKEAAEFAPFYYSELAKWKKFAEETHISAGN